MSPTLLVVPVVGDTVRVSEPTSGKSEPAADNVFKSLAE